MKRLFVLLCLLGIGFSQIFEEEVDDPDEDLLLALLLDRILQPFCVTAADSTELIAHGYSPAAVDSILMWQTRSGQGNPLHHRRPCLEGQDLTILEDDLRQRSWQTKTTFRQRVDISKDFTSTRIVNKGRVHAGWGDWHFLLEQDPGEVLLTDHWVLSVNLGKTWRFDELILGDYHLDIGQGLILRQQGVRRSLNPGSLTRSSNFNVRPHYSSRETRFFRGLAGTFTQGDLQGMIFVSSRSARGRMVNGNFLEDSDGIHPVAADLVHRPINTAGLAGDLTWHKLKLFGGMMIREEISNLSTEFGVSMPLGGSHLIQVHVAGFSGDDSRLLATWRQDTRGMTWAVQFRRYNAQTALAWGAVPAALGAGADNEQGIGFRMRVKLLESLQCSYALESGRPVALTDLTEIHAREQHKLQLIQRLEQGRLQVDLGKKDEVSMDRTDGWPGSIQQVTVSTAALAYSRSLGATVDYKFNLKSAWQGQRAGFLIQQRFSGRQGKMTWFLGFARYAVPEYALRLSMYESGLVESFSFFTAYDDGERWTLILRVDPHPKSMLEMKFSRTRSHTDLEAGEQLDLSLQLSIVL